MEIRRFAAATAVAAISAAAAGAFVPRLLGGVGGRIDPDVAAAFAARPGQVQQQPQLGEGPPGAPAQAQGGMQPAVGGQAQGRQQAGGQQPMSAEELKRAQAQALLQFTAEHGAMFGALAVCAPQAAEVVGKCANLVITRWPELTRLPPPDDPRLPEALQKTWDEAAEAARRVQSGQTPPMTCERVVETAQRAPLWQVCERLGGPDAGAGQQGGARQQGGAQQQGGAGQRPAQPQPRDPVGVQNLQTPLRVQ